MSGSDFGATSRLEATKHVVEILAIVVAATWTLYEFGFQRWRERERGEEASWANVTLVANPVALSPMRHWVGLTAQVKNESKGKAQLFFLYWRLSLPPKDGTVAPVLYKQWHDSRAVRDQVLFPGETAEFSQPVVIEGNHRAVRVYVQVVFRSFDGGLRCRLKPDTIPPGTDLEEHDGPAEFCLADPRGMQCRSGDAACYFQTTERLIELGRVPLDVEFGDGASSGCGWLFI